MKTNIHVRYLTHFFSDEEMFLTRVLEKTKTKCFMFNILFFFPSKFVPFMTKIFQSWKATNYNTELAHCMLYTYDYKHTLRICNRSTYCFSTAAIVARTCLNVALYIILTWLIVYNIDNNTNFNCTYYNLVNSTRH